MAALQVLHLHWILICHGETLQYAHTIYRTLLSWLLDRLTPSNPNNGDQRLCYPTWNHKSAKWDAFSEWIKSQKNEASNCRRGSSFLAFLVYCPIQFRYEPFLPIHWRISQLAKQSASDIIPLPTIGLRSSVSLFSSATEREDARQGLESLNREVTDPHDTSQRLQQTLQDLQQLLQPDNVAQ
jgi:hypothetical protein